MGIEFRDGRYLKRVWWGKRTVKEGEAAAIWSLNGTHRQVIGPRRQHLFFSTIRFLDRYTARNGEYLVVKFKDGRIEHVTGPQTMFLNPVLHDEITIQKAIQLQSSSESIVVYRSTILNPADNGGTGPARPTAYDEKDEKHEVTRKVISGPAVFVPAVGEWVQSFAWISKNEETKSNVNVIASAADAHKNYILKTSQNRTSWNIKMRTADNVNLTITVSVVYKLTDIDTMLNATSNPLNDMVSALQSDLSMFGANFASADLNQLGDNKNLGNPDRYQQLYKCAKSIGFEVVEVLMTAFSISEELQRHQDEYNAQQSKLKSQLAEAEQKQALADLELLNRSKRADAERAIAKAQLEHELEMEKITVNNQAESRAARNKETIEFLGDLKGLGVDLTKLLVTVVASNASENSVLNAPALNHLRGDGNANQSD